MSIEAMEVFAAFAVMAIAICVPNILARRIKHGEARFDKEGKLIDDE